MRLWTFSLNLLHPAPLALDPGRWSRYISDPEMTAFGLPKKPIRHSRTLLENAMSMEPYDYENRQGIIWIIRPPELVKHQRALVVDLSLQK